MEIKGLEKLGSWTSPVFVAIVCVMVTALSKKLATFSKSSSVKPLHINVRIVHRVYRRKEAYKSGRVEYSGDDLV